MLCIFVRLYIILHLSATFVCSKEIVYVSRFSGKDSTTCGKQSLPCRTISYAMLQVSEGSYIYLNGTNTSQNPYTCQPLDPGHPGTYPITITKTVSFVGIRSRAYISCLDGNQWMVNGTKHKNGLQISFHGLAFRNTTLRFLDAVVNITDSLFLHSRYLSMSFVIFNLSRFDLALNNVVFKGNKLCMYVKSSTSVNIFISIKNSSFLLNGYHDFSTLALSSILSLESKNSNIDFKLRNCNFKRNTFIQTGLISVLNSEATTKLLLDRIEFDENGQIGTLSGLPSGLIFLHSAHVIMTLDFGFVHGTFGTFLSVGSHSVQVNVSHTVMEKFYGPDKGVFDIHANLCASLSIKDSCFRNGKTISYSSVIAMAAPNLVLTIQNSTIHNISNAGNANLVYLNSHNLKSPNGTEDVLRLNIINSSFSDCVSLKRGGVFLIASNLFLTISQSWFVRIRAKRADGVLYFITHGATAIYLENVYFLENSAGDHGIVAGTAKRSNSMFNFTWNNVWFVDNNLQGRELSYIGVLYLWIERKISSINLSSTRLIRNTGIHSRVVFIVFWNSSKASHSLTLDNCIFRENVADFGLFFVYGQARLSCKDTIFDSNYISGRPLFFVRVGIFNIGISNSTFVNNSGGIVAMTVSKNSCLRIEDSFFLSNRHINGPGGAMYIEMVNGENSESQTHKRCENLHHNVLIKNVSFHENIGKMGGALAILNAKVEIVNCVFVNNFAAVTGGQVTTLGATSVKVLNSVFKQTIRSTIVNETKFIVSSFLRIYSTGELLLNNTNVYLDTISNEPLILATRSYRVVIYNSLVTTCPLGSALKWSVYYYGIRTIMVVTLDVSCMPCDYNFYSLQRGHAKGATIDNNFRCMPCPRGADCIPAIKSKLNFWGYNGSFDPPTLAFTLCPFGYCRSPQANSSKYNDCQGKRTGVMCGSCLDGYTEALWSTYCTPIENCNDYWFWILFLILVLFMAILLVFKPPFITFSLKHVLWFRRFTTSAANPFRFRSGLSMIRSLSLDEEERQNNIQLSSREHLKHDKRQFSRFLEIIFYFYQIAQLLLSSYSLSQFFDSKILPLVLGFFNFEPRLHKRGFLCPFPGLTPKTKLAFKILPVFGTMLAIFTMYFFHVFINKVRRSQRPSVGSYIQASVKTIFLGYTTLATVGISLIRCVYVAGEDRWFYNANVVCYQWWQYVSFAFNGIFVIPFIFVLAWASFKVHHGTITVRQFLLAIAFPLPFLLYWLFRVVCPSKGVDVEESENFEAIKEMLLGPYKEPGNGSKHGTMYWQSVLIARRFILVLIFCTVTEPSIRLFCMTLACVFVLFFHLKIRPFRNALANNLESLSLLLLVMLGLIHLLKSVFVGFEENIKGPLVTVFKVFQWLEIVILGLFPALLSLLVCLAIISLFLRVLFMSCRSLFKSIFGCCTQRNLSEDRRRLEDFCENLND